MQRTEQNGREVIITRSNKVVERHEFPTVEEAQRRARTVREALSWEGTPFRDCTDVKGPQGGVDCAMLLVRTYVDTGQLAPFDPRPYAPQWHVHNNEEKFLGWVESRLHCIQVEMPRIGDVLVYHYGRCFSHGGILINNEELVHAYAKSGTCHVSLLRETDLCFLRSGAPRPVRYYEVAS